MGGKLPLRRWHIRVVRAVMDTRIAAYLFLIACVVAGTAYQILDVRKALRADDRSNALRLGIGAAMFIAVLFYLLLALAGKVPPPHPRY